MAPSKVATEKTLTKNRHEISVDSCAFVVFPFVTGALRNRRRHYARNAFLSPSLRVKGLTTAKLIRSGEKKSRATERMCAAVT